MANGTPRGDAAPPRLARVHARPRLFRLLDRASRSAVAWVQAPPGAGKTVLIASWLARRRLRAIWLDLDASADAAGVFGRIAGAASRRIGPRASPPRFSPEHLVTPAAYARRFFHALASARGAPSVVVLDDYHEVPAGSLLHAMLAEGAHAAGPVSIVISSRSEPPPAFARLRASGGLAALPASALACSPAETRAIARLHAPGSPRIPLEAANGWAAGVVLLAAAAARSRDPDADGRGNVFDYLAHEAFGRLPPETRDVLLRTAPLATIDAPLAASLAANERAPDLLAQLARGGWFTERLAGPRPAYRYHALFREFLLARAGEELGHAAIAETRRRAAAFAAGAGDVDTALSLLADAQAWEQLAALVAANAPAMLLAGRAEAVSRWIDLIPPAYRDAIPWLGYWRGLARFPGDPRGAVATIHAAHDAFVRANDALGAYRSWASAVEVQFFALDDMAPLDRSIVALDELRSRFPDFPDGETEAAVVAAAVCAFVNRRATDPRLEQWEERALAIALAPGEPRARMAVGRQLGIHLSFWTADLVRARVVFDALRPLARASDGDASDALMWHVGEANWHAHTGDGAGARAVADRGLEIASRGGLHLWDSVLLSVKVFGALTEDDLASARADLALLGAAVEGGPRLSLCAHVYVAGVVALRAGDRGVAIERSRAAVRIAEEAHSPLAAAAARVTWAAAAALGAGEGPSLEDAARAALAAGYAYAAAGAWFAAAAIALGRGDEDAAAAALEQALPAARRIGCLNTVWTGRAELAELCALAIERGIEADLALRIARVRRLTAGPRARGIAAWPWGVRVEALGGLRIASEAAPPRPGKTQRKPLELLRLLVAHGPRGVRSEAAADALWPDAAGDTARHALETTTWRLRRMLGDPAAVSQRDGRLALDSTRVFVDAWAIEALADRADALARRGALDAARRALDAAAELSRGELFGDDPDPALAPYRARLRQRLGASR